MIIKSIIPGRIRIIEPKLKKEYKLAALIELSFLQISGIENIRINPVNGSIKVLYNHKLLKHNTILSRMKNLLYNKNLNFDEQIFKDYLEERKNLSKASNNLFIFGMSYLILKIKKYFFGNFYFSSSLPVLIIASLVTIISDYPFLKKISRQFNDKIDNFFIYLGLLLAFIREGDLTLFLLFTKSLIESFNAYSGLQVQKQFIKNCSIGMQVEKIDKKGEKITLPASVIKPGDEIIVSENNIIRFDGIIIEGQALVNHVYYNGRCVIEQFKENDNVKHGMYIIKGKIKIRITKRIDYTPKEDIELNQMSIYKRAKNYQEKQLLVSTLFAFTGWVLTGSIITPLSIYLVMGPAAADFAVKSGLGLYLKKLRDRGIILRNVNKMEKIRDVDIIVFDKTGTLSSNNLVINNIEVINDNFSENKVKKIFSCCEKGILHPIANSIEIDFDDNIIQDKEYIPGKGIRAVYKNNEVLVGNEKLMKMSNIEITLRENKKPGIDIYVAVEGSLIARVVLTEVVNDQAFKMIEKLKSLNLELAIISGDRQENLSYVADSLGVKNYQGDMSYDKKRKFIKQLKNNNNNVIMVGDGINDTGAMKAADISITFRREDINLGKVWENADCILRKKDLMLIVDLILLSRSTGEQIILSNNLCRTNNFIFGLLTLSGYYNPFQAKAINTLNSITAFICNLPIVKLEKMIDKL